MSYMCSDLVCRTHDLQGVFIDPTWCLLVQLGVFLVDLWQDLMDMGVEIEFFPLQFEEKAELIKQLRG